MAQSGAQCRAQCPHPWGHAPEPECPKPSPLLKMSLCQFQLIPARQLISLPTLNERLSCLKLSCLNSESVSSI